MMTNDFLQSQYQYRVGKLEKILYLFCFILLIIIYTTQLDFIIADFIYAKTFWKFQQAFWTETILHKSIKVAVIIIYLSLFIKLLKLVKNNSNKFHIYDLFVLLLTIIISVSLVSISKRIFDSDCPWHLIRYGGDKQFFSIFNYPDSLKPSHHCFPASHASVGFSWIALYFFFLVKNHPYKNHYLVATLVLGFSLGIAQQIRGAHFFSHDIWSLIICLSTSVFIYSKAYKGEKSNEKK